MTTLFTIDLTIKMPDGGRQARQLLNLYFTDLPVDIQETANHLCDANEAVQARKFAKLTLKRADVWSRITQLFMLGSGQGDSSFSLYDYPIPGKDGLPLCEKYGRQIELKEVVLFDKEATEASPPDHCWVCKG